MKKIAGPILGLLLLSTLAYGQAFSTGDVLISVSNGQVQWRRKDASLVKTLTTGLGGFTTGMAFDTAKNLYVTNFSGTTVSKFDPSGTLLGAFGSGYNSQPESILFDGSGNAYVGQAGGTKRLLKFSPSGSPLGSFVVATEDRGSDWIDLASDQCTVYYTSEGPSIKRFNVCTNSQLSTFNVVPLPNSVAYALRLLPKGGLLVANTGVIARLDASGKLIQTYSVPGENSWFALNLDPDGTSFWSANINSSNVYKFDINTGVQLLKFNTGTSSNTVFGLVVAGEITAAGTVDYLDAISLLSGGGVTSDVTVLAAQGIHRDGVASDGVAQLVLRFNAPTAGTVAFSLVDASIGGILLPDSPENGSLRNLQGGSLLTIPTVSTPQGQKAFVIYTAPTRFVRGAFPNDATLSQRQTFIQTTFIATSGVITPPASPLKIVRPLVWLVHGIWSCRTSWNNFIPLITDSRFVFQRADYRDPPAINPKNDCVSSQSFAVSAATAYIQLSAAIVSYRVATNVAAVQADVVTHSMGGPVVRTMVLQPTFLNDPDFPTFGHGPIHKLMTIAGVHTGTPIATYVLGSACLTSVFTNDFGKPTGNGAVADLATGQAVQTPFPAHTIVGLANATQKVINSSLINEALNYAFILDLHCVFTSFPGFDSVLQSGDNDLLVPGLSQRGGRSGPATTVTNVVHSSPFLGNSELETDVIANRIADLLNANSDDTTVFVQF